MHLAAVLKSAFALGSQQCTPRQIGPGQHVEGGTRGAACLLAAFRDGCRPAKYVLGPRLCTGLHRLGTDVVAVRCRQGRSAPISLTTFRT